MHVAECESCRGTLSELEANLRIAASLKRVMGRPPRFSLPAAPPQIDGYRILREVGHGGMGTVFAAEQTHPRRTVAIKVLNATRAVDPASERLFRREIDALGRLKHPGIAAIHGAGRTADQRPYLVMELVEGLPLREFVERAGLPIRSRVELFKQITDAVAYAHQRGVIHRDLKPGNVIVVEESTPGRSLQPKLLDFGLARVFDAETAGQATFETEAGHVAGTLPYMSPEQVRGAPGELDVRSDVYSLGVMFYELLTGRLPYEVDRARLLDAVRVINEVPPRPPSQHMRALRGDLETIVLKALAKEPDRRYAGAAALADDLVRYLADEPIAARRATLGYQLGRMLRRHRAASALAAAMFVMLAGFGVWMSVLYSRAATHAGRAEHAERVAREETRAAEREAQVALHVRNLLIDVFNVARPDIADGRTITARELLDRAAERIARRPNKDPLIQAALSEAIGSVYRKLGEAQAARGPLERALRLRLDNGAPDAMETARNATELSITLREIGDLKAAAEAARLSLEICRRRVSADGWHVANVMVDLAQLQSDTGDAAGAERVLREALPVLRASPHAREVAPPAGNALAGALAAQGKYAEAVPLMRELLDGARAMAPSVEVAAYENNLAWLLLNVGELDEAESLARLGLEKRRRVLSPRHAAIGSSLTVLGALKLRRGDLPAAEEMLREAVEIRRRVTPRGSAPLGESLGFLGEAVRRSGRFADAEPLLRESLDMLRVALPPGDLSIAGAAERLVDLYAQWGRPDEAERVRRATMPPTTQSSAHAATPPTTTQAQ